MLAIACAVLRIVLAMCLPMNDFHVWIIGIRAT